VLQQRFRCCCGRGLVRQERAQRTTARVLKLYYSFTTALLLFYYSAPPREAAHVSALTEPMSINRALTEPMSLNRALTKPMRQIL
jgi:hypothetical protein